jgi:hypothetical protein
VLIVGAYPPPPRTEARRTMATVRARAHDGDEVEVLSTMGSAAHHRGAINGVAGAWEVWRRARAYDAVVVHAGLESPLRRPAGRRARLVRALDCLAWGLVLRRARGSCVVVPDLDLIPGSIGGRTGRFLFSGARRVIVASEHSRARLVETGCCPADRVELLARPAAAAAAWDSGWDEATDQASAEELIIRRAAHDRRERSR